MLREPLAPLADRVERSLHPNGDLLVLQPVRRKHNDPRPLSQPLRAVRRRDAKPSSSRRSSSVKPIATAILLIANPPRINRKENRTNLSIRTLAEFADIEECEWARLMFRGFNGK